MDKTVKYTKPLIAVIGAALTVFFGGWDIMLQILIGFVVLDYVTGVAAAWYTKTLNSDIGARGIMKKILLFVVVALAYQIDKAIGGQEIFRNLAIWFYLANEALSVIENAGRCGVPIPAFLKVALEQIKEKSDTGEQITPSD